MQNVKKKWVFHKSPVDFSEKTACLKILQYRHCWFSKTKPCYKTSESKKNRFIELLPSLHLYRWPAISKHFYATQSNNKKDNRFFVGTFPVESNQTTSGFKYTIQGTVPYHQPAIFEVHYFANFPSGGSYIFSFRFPGGYTYTWRIIAVSEGTERPHGRGSTTLLRGSY